MLASHSCHIRPPPDNQPAFHQMGMGARVAVKGVDIILRDYDYLF